MGMGAALSLLRAGVEVTGCDPRASARDEFISAGGAAVAKASDLPVGMEALVVLVVNAAQTEAAIFGADGAAPRMAKGSVIISSATMAPDAARALAAKADAAGLLYLDAPVSGGAIKARAGEMTVMGAGSEAAFAKAAPR
jgi:3-hydroxyisobutyrate dehydrogenase-like beta-hydroxyacid dehydrogenase